MAHLPDNVVAVFWFASTAFLGTSGWVVAGRLFPNDPILNKVAHAIVFGWAHIVAVGTALGMLGLLVPVVLLVGVTASAALTLIIITRRVLKPVNADDPSSGPCTQTSLAERWVWPAVWAIVFAFWVGHAVTGGLLKFPTDWDTLMYHLPLVDHWLQARSLYAPDGRLWSNPGNNELVTLWLVAPFSGDFLYALTNLPAAVLLACASVELCRQVGLSTTWRNLAALAVVTNFVVFRQLIDAENDVAVAALFLVCLAYGLRYSARGQAGDLILAAISLGLLAGVKYYALGYAAVAATTAVLLISRRMGLRVLVRATVVGAIGCVVFGGYWFTRNWIAGGSPLFPLFAPVKGDDLGYVYPNLWQTTFIGNGRSELLDLAVEAVLGMTGPCHLMAILGFPVIILWLLASGALRSRQAGVRGEGAARLALTAAMVGAGVVLLVTPFAVEDVPGTLNQMHGKYCPVRYGLCFLSLAVLGLSALLADLSHGVRVVVTALTGLLLRQRAVQVAGALAGAVIPILFAVGVTKQLMAVPRVRFSVEVTNSLLIGCIVLLVMAQIRFLLIAYRPPRWVALALASVVVIGFSVGVKELSARWHHGYASFYDRMQEGELFDHFARTEQTSTTVCVLDMRPYPFFGSARQFRVCQPGSVRSYEWWRQFLRERDVRLIAVRLDQLEGYNGWGKAYLWVIDRPRMFVSSESSGAELWPYALYRINWDGE